MDHKYPFGEMKGKPLSEVSVKDLKGMISWFEKKGSFNDPKYGAKNKELANAAQMIIKAKEAGLSQDNGFTASDVAHNNYPKKNDKLEIMLMRIENQQKQILGILKHNFPGSLQVVEESTPF